MAKPIAAGGDTYDTHIFTKEIVDPVQIPSNRERRKESEEETNQQTLIPKIYADF